MLNINKSISKMNSQKIIINSARFLNFKLQNNNQLPELTLNYSSILLISFILSIF